MRQDFWLNLNIYETLVSSPHLLRESHAVSTTTTAITEWSNRPRGLMQLNAAWDGRVLTGNQNQQPQCRNSWIGSAICVVQQALRRLCVVATRHALLTRKAPLQLRITRCSLAIWRRM